METNRIYFDSISKFFNRNLVIAIVFTIAATWSFPIILWQTGPYQDDSIAMLMVKMQDIVFGQDLIFTYGPLGYLMKPYYITTPLWIHSAAFLTISHVLAFTSFGFFSIKRKIALKHVIPIAIILSFYITITISPYVYLAAMTLVFFLYLSSTKKLSFLIKSSFLITLSFLCSILFFVKFDLAIGSFGLLFLFSIFLVLKKRWQELAIGILSYFGLVILLSNFLLESPSNLIPYVSTSLELASGYSAMSIDTYEVFTTPLAVASISLLIITLIIKKFRVDKPELFFLFVFLFYLLFKHGTVRNDGHVMNFFFGGALILYIYYSSFFKAKGKFFHLKTFAYFLVVTMVLSGIIIADFPGFTKGSIQDGIEKFVEIIKYRTFTMQSLSFPTMNLLLSNDEFAKSYVSQGKEILKSIHPLFSSTEELLKDKSVDIFPWDIALIYAYDFNWNPRPVLQSFNVFTSKLDYFNAKHLQDMSSAPEFVLFTAKGLDGRFPYFDEPATLRELLCNYKTVKIDGPFMIMEKKPNSCSEPKILKTQKIKFDEIVTVPSHDSDFLYVNVEIKQNVLGFLLDKFYKPPQIRIEINGDPTYRFIAPPASNGILLSLSNKEIANFPTINYNITSFRLTTDTSSYYNDIELEFFEIDDTFEQMTPIINFPPFPVPDEILIQVWEDKNLISLYPEVQQGNFQGMKEWAINMGWNEDERLSVLIPEGQIPSYLPFPVPDEILFQIWNEREDLRSAFPEIEQGNYDTIKQWAQYAGWYQDERLSVLTPAGQIPSYLPFPVPDEILIQVWEDKNLISLYPEVQQGNFQGMKEWAINMGWKEDKRLSVLIPEGQIPVYPEEQTPDYLLSPFPVPDEILIQVWEDKNLISLYPEVQQGNFQGMKEWAINMGWKEDKRLSVLIPVPDKILLQIWIERDLRSSYPEVEQGNFDGMKEWAATIGWNEDERLAVLIPEGETPQYIFPVSDDILLQIWIEREDLRSSLPLFRMNAMKEWAATIGWNVDERLSALIPEGQTPEYPLSTLPVSDDTSQQPVYSLLLVIIPIVVAAIIVCPYLLLRLNLLKKTRSRKQIKN